MESNLDVGGYSPDDAVRALAAVTADQAATRVAAMPSQRYLLVVSAYMGAMFMIYAIPDAWGWPRLVISILLIVTMLVTLYRFCRRRAVRAERWAFFVPARPGLIVMIVLIGVILTVLLGVEGTAVAAHIPWWGQLGIGAAIALLTYTVTRWCWRDWARAAR